MRDYVAAFLILLLITTSLQHCARTVLRPTRATTYRNTLEEY